MHIPDWVSDAVFYQIFPERFYNGNPANDPTGTEPWGGKPTRENFFGGDLEGIIYKLDYVAKMGFNALYLNPIFTAGTNHKYDTHDYFTIDPTFGDDATFDRLIKEAHARGIKVVLDGVFNHCGDGFAPFLDVKKNGTESKYCDWFYVYNYPIRSSPYPNYASCGGAYYLPRLNTHNPKVEAFIHKVACYWLERGIDGWRLDVPYEIHPDFWRRFRKVVKERYPDAYLVGEEWRDPSNFLKGDTLDGTMHYGLRSLVFDFLVSNALTGEAFSRALETLKSQLPKGSEKGMLTLLGSHDTARLLTVCKEDTDLAVLLYAFLLTMPGAPMIYYGDENGMFGDNDPDCRRTMVWDESKWNHTIRDSVSRLLELRKSYTCLRNGKFETVFANDRVYAYSRSEQDQQLLIVLNNTRVPRCLSIPVTWPNGTKVKDLLCHEDFIVQNQQVTFDPLTPRRAWILLPY